jgi:hypothetical protein
LNRQCAIDAKGQVEEVFLLENSLLENSLAFALGVFRRLGGKARARQWSALSHPPLLFL